MTIRNLKSRLLGVFSKIITAYKKQVYGNREEKKAVATKSKEWTDLIASNLRNTVLCTVIASGGLIVLHHPDKFNYSSVVSNFIGIAVVILSAIFLTLNIGNGIIQALYLRPIKNVYSMLVYTLFILGFTFVSMSFFNVMFADQLVKDVQTANQAREQEKIVMQIHDMNEAIKKIATPQAARKNHK